MSPAFIKGCARSLPNARVTFDKVHVVWHANAAVDRTRRIEQRSDPALGRTLKGMRWTLPEDAFSLSVKAGAALHESIRAPKMTRTARARVYKERLREILDRRQIDAMRRALSHRCGCVMCSKVEPMKDVAALVRRHLEGIVAWVQTRQTNGFLEALNGLFQAAKRRARGYTRIETIKVVIFLIAGKLDFAAVDPHAR
jgi:transposase